MLLAPLFHRLRLFGILSLAVGATMLVQAVTAADKPKTKDVAVKDITLAIPDNWASEPPSNALRLAQFKIPAAEGDKEGAELVISSFGGDGGGVDANFQRWVKEFSAEGRVTKLTQGDSKLGKYYVCDNTGTYNKRVGPPQAGKTTAVEGQRSYAVVLQVKDKGTYFLKLVGPEKTVTAIGDTFREVFGADAKTEQPYEGK